MGSTCPDPSGTIHTHRPVLVSALDAAEKPHTREKSQT